MLHYDYLSHSELLRLTIVLKQSLAALREDNVRLGKNGFRTVKSANFRKEVFINATFDQLSTEIKAKRTKMKIEKEKKLKRAERTMQAKAQNLEPAADASVNDRVAASTVTEPDRLRSCTSSHTAPVIVSPRCGDRCENYLALMRRQAILEETRREQVRVRFGLVGEEAKKCAERVGEVKRRAMERRKKSFRYRQKSCDVKLSTCHAPHLTGYQTNAMLTNSLQTNKMLCV